MGMLLYLETQIKSLLYYFTSPKQTYKQSNKSYSKQFILAYICIIMMSGLISPCTCDVKV